jgi:hypothetical protein
MGTSRQVGVPDVRIEPRPPGRSDRAATLLRRAVELARVAARGLAILAVAAAASAGLAWVVWIAERPPAGANDWAARGVVLAIALLPAGVLAVFLAGLRQLAELPRRVRELPPDVRAQVADVRASGARREPVGVVGAVFRLGGLLVQARDVLSPYAVVTAVLRPALLLAAIVAAAAAAIEIPIALGATLVLTGSPAPG